MATTTYKLARQIGGRGAFARVTIDVVETNEPFKVYVSEGLERPSSYIAAAIFGIEFAREQVFTEHSYLPGARVTILNIEESPADTLLLHVAYAAYHAFCDAIGASLDRRIEIDGGNQCMLFPLGRAANTA